MIFDLIFHVESLLRCCIMRVRDILDAVEGIAN